MDQEEGISVRASIKYHAMLACGGVELEFHSLLTSALGIGASHSGRLTAGERDAGIHSVAGWVDPRPGSTTINKKNPVIPNLTEIEPRSSNSYAVTVLNRGRSRRRCTGRRRNKSPNICIYRRTNNDTVIGRMIYKHVSSLLHVTAFLERLQGNILQRKIQ